ncbi:MAG: DedA family protein [Thermoleophilia bacterium]
MTQPTSEAIPAEIPRPRRALRAALSLGGVALVAVVLGIVVGAIPFPDVEELLLDVGPTLGQWTYVLVGGLAFAETAAFVGLAVPGEITIVLGGFVAGQGVIGLVPLIAIVWAAAVAGDLVSYWLGRRLGRGFLLRHGGALGVTPARLAWAERFFERHGGKTILIGRFIGFFRSFGPFLAGASHMPFRRFLVADVLGAGLWSTAFAVLGYVFWQSFDRAVELAGHGKLVLAGVVVLVALVVAAKHLRRPRVVEEG